MTAPVLIVPRALSRRSFLSTSAAALAGSAVANPARAAAQAVGVKPADLPDLTIKQIKVYVINRAPTRPARLRRRLVEGRPAPR